MITIINADAFHMAKLLQKDFHRAVIPAPYGADGILVFSFQNNIATF
jgi:hypothetical protein